MDSERFDAAQSEDGRYRLLVEAINDYAIYMLSPKGIISSWNSGAERFKGYKPHEIIGQHFSTFYTPEDKAIGLPKTALETADREGKFEAEGWRVRKDGTRFWAFVVIDPVRSVTGDLVGFAKITRDLTERKKAETVLRESEEQFRLLVQGVTDYAIYMLNPDGIVASWNLGAQRIKGYAPEEIIGQHFSRFYTDEDKANDEPQKALATSAREGRFEKEGWRVRKDGTQFRANVIIDAIRDDTGKLLGFAKVTRDVTAARENQAELDRTRDALFQAQKMDAIGQLTGGVAHDFNNLLTAVLGSLELLRKRLPDDVRSIALLDNAMQGAQRGAVLTQRLLAFARRQDMQRESVDLQDLVRGMAGLLERSLGSQVDIQMAFPLKPLTVFTDPHQLELAILNLVVNARDAMPNGGTITIGAKEQLVKAKQLGDLPAGRYVCISIADEGEGMDAKTLQRATEPFFTTKGVGKGTGLGLPMAHGVAEQSGGQLAIESTKGAGTTIKLWLPLTEIVKPPILPPELIKPLAHKPVQPLKILVVDDDNLVLRNTVFMLEDLGYEVVEASSADLALKILSSRNDIELVVTDQNMPEMTGTELAYQVKTNWPTIDILLATGFAELPLGEGAGLRKLAKPYTQAALSAAISDASSKTPSVLST